MTVVLVISTIVIFLVIDWVKSHRGIMVYRRGFRLSFTMADGGKRVRPH